jgi:hypothetical protein
VANKYSPEFVQRVQEIAHSDEISVLLDGLIEKYSDNWRTSDPGNTQNREHLYRMIQAVEGLKAEFRAVSLDEVITAHNRALTKASKWS